MLIRLTARPSRAMPPRRPGPARWEPGPASEAAAAELANKETRPAGGPWGEDPSRTVASYRRGNREKVAVPR